MPKCRSLLYRLQPKKYDKIFQMSTIIRKQPNFIKTHNLHKFYLLHFFFPKQFNLQQKYPPKTLYNKQSTMALKTSIFSLLTFLLILPNLTHSLEYPQHLLDETYFQDLYNMNIHFPVSVSPASSSLSPNAKTPRVPALFVLGDSSVDCGNNNFLGTFARADRLPYGRDFDTHQPTGRFCNGRIPVDFLGLFLFLISDYGFFLDSGFLLNFTSGYMCISISDSWASFSS